MSDNQRVDFSQLETGHAFPPASYILEPGLIDSYLKATRETNAIYDQKNLVPPSAVAAYALAALANELEIPPGTIHTSQEIESVASVHVNDTITSHARVSNKRSRRNMEIMSIDFEVTNQNDITVLLGKTTFMSSPQFSM